MVKKKSGLLFYYYCDRLYSDINRYTVDLKR